MRLFLIETNSSTEGQERLFARVKLFDDGKCRHIFIVPDRFTVSVERELCEKCFPEGFYRADVVSFTRLAVKTVGKNIGRTLSKEGTVVLLDKVVGRLGSELKYYGKLKGYGFARELFASIALLRSSGITPEILAERSLAAEGKTRDKLSDTALIYKGYLEELKNNYSDTLTRLEALSAAISERGEFRDARFYIFGFNLFSNEQRRIIEALILNSESVSISYLRGEGVNSRCIPTRHIEDLINFCAANGVEVEKEEAHKVFPYPLDYLKRHVFAGSGRELGKKHAEAVFRGGGFDITLFIESDPREEIRAIAREIGYLVRKSGYRYKDVAVLCNDRALYPVIDGVFDRCGIPKFIDAGYDILDGLPMRYLLLLADCAKGNDLDSYLRLARHPFSGLTREEIRVFDGYTKTYNLVFRPLSLPFTLGDCEIPEKIRRKLRGEAEKFPLSATYAEYCDIASGILLSDDIADKCELYAESGNPRLAASSKTEKIFDFLEEIRFLNGKERATVAEFARLLTSALSDVKITDRPAYSDCVFVGSGEESRFSEIKALFVADASDGKIPIKHGDGLIFTAMDEEYMLRLGIGVWPTRRMRNLLERGIALDIMTKPSEKLYVSCAETDLAGDLQIKGEFFEEISRLLSLSPMSLAETKNFTEEEKLRYKLVNPENALYEYMTGGIPSEFTDAAGKFLLDKGLLRPYNAPPRVKGEILSARENFISASFLECYFTCPFLRFMRYDLGVRPETDGALNPADAGTGIHNVLGDFFRNNSDRVYAGEDLTFETEKAIKKEFGSERYRRFDNDPISVYVIENIKNELRRLIPILAENMRNSDFRPVGFEVSFGYGEDDAPEITVGGETYKFRGRIDRVDRFGDYVSVVDYKTGKVDSGLDAIYIGKKIQLYIYLSRFMREGLKPAGAFYLPIKSGSTVSGRSYAMKGQMLKGTEMFSRFDGRIAGVVGEYAGPAVDFKIKSAGKGIFYKNGNLLSEEEFGSIAEYVKALAAEAVTEIVEGYAEKKPIKNACEYCDYAKICGKVPQRPVPDVDISSFCVGDSGETEK